MRRRGERCGCVFFFFQADDGIREYDGTGVQTCALPICSVLVDAFSGHLVRYRSNRGAALQLVSAGQSARDQTLDIAELAAYQMVASLILNLDATITKD